MPFTKVIVRKRARGACPAGDCDGAAEPAGRDAPSVCRFAVSLADVDGVPKIQSWTPEAAPV